MFVGGAKEQTTRSIVTKFGTYIQITYNPVQMHEKSFELFWKSIPFLAENSKKSVLNL